ncbi:protein kinase domain-containing protein [Colletotrichum plurivorum]|uniref:Protein kinase domain-containing protein n=1 Tax=Colletotrichum plurivorum TaxID=2175906 RepID=A0A8H6KAN4_9PEZI|nr:protein kinase domain-containing protein [Colletotrichum plurivorum]
MMPPPSKTTGPAPDNVSRGRQTGQSSLSGTAESLSQQLKKSSVQHPYLEGNCFVPLDSLERLITEQSVVMNLQRSRDNDKFLKDARLCTTIGQFVCPKLQTHSTSRDWDTSGRKLFGILVLIDKSHAIDQFRGEGLSDKDLPFRIDRAGGSPQLCRKQDSKSPIKAFSGWKPAELESFEALQWSFLSPFLSIHRHYDVGNKVLLPFVHSDERHDSSLRSGGYGSVFKVRIHHAHHNFNGGEQVPRPKLTRHVILWMADQCQGLSTGLNKIHSYQSRFDLPCGSKGLSSIRTKLYGRHGDLKPENVLWFKDHRSPEGVNGILKISDFGFAEINSNESRSNKHVPPMPTYRPPECDLPGEVISQSFDIWTLGCLYLEFATWLLKGFDAACDTFPDARLGDGAKQDAFVEDMFFRIEARTAHLKASVVKWIDYLHAERNCTGYLHELLDFILAFLLHPDPRERATCAQVVQKLSSMQEKYQKNAAYILEGFSRSTTSMAPLPYHGKDPRTSNNASTLSTTPAQPKV